MRRIRIGADGLAEHVNHPVRAFPLGNQRVERPGRRPHQVAACLVVLRVFVGNAAGVQDGAHQALADVIARVIILTGEILLADVIEDIVDACYHLAMWQCHRVPRVQDGKARDDLLVCKDVTYFLLCLLIGDDTTCIHLRARPGHRQHAADRQRLAGRLLKAHEIFLPRIFLAVDRNGHRLGIVADRTAADGQEQIRLMLARDLDALIELCERRIRHDARDLCHILALRLEDLDDIIVDAVLLDGTAAVDQDDVLAVLRQFRVQVIERLIAKIKLCRVAIRKIS